MRTTSALLLTATLTAAVVAPRVAHADDVVGTYDVKYEEMANNCTDAGMSLGKGVLGIELRKGALVVDIERIPLMSGAPAKAGKLHAQSKLGKTSIEGLDGKFSIAGRVEEGMLQLLFVAEYFVKGKPLCTQSWKVAGVSQKRVDGKSAPTVPDGVGAFMQLTAPLR
jgi:hypothetical protein